MNVALGVFLTLLLVVSHYAVAVEAYYAGKCSKPNKCPKCKRFQKVERNFPLARLYKIGLN